MKKFLVLYLMPQAGLGDWMKKSEEERKPAEDKMKEDWDKWAEDHKDILLETAGAGKTMKVMSGKSESAHNDIMLYSLVQGDGKEAVAKLFQNHPHLGIPDSWIEVMECNPVPQM